MYDPAATAIKQLDSPHYLKSVTELGDTQRLVTIRDVYSSANIKLVASGTNFNSALYERLLNHKLLPPLDQCLAVEGVVDGQSLRDEAAMLLLQDSRLRAMQAALGVDEGRLPQIVADIPLNPAIAFKLTVMREKRPELFQHSIFVALVCSYLGVRLGLPAQKLERLATAGLLHDIGILHIDPGLLEQSYRMDEQERKHLYAHPLTAWMILNEYQEYSTDVLDAVLQHHERLDGSGYPRGLKGEAIGLLGQILAVVEVVAGPQGGKKALDRKRLETILKLNAKRLGRQLIGYLEMFYKADAKPAPCTDEDRQLMHSKLGKLARVFSVWQEWGDRCAISPQVCGFINERMHILKVELLDAGLVPDAAEANQALIDDGSDHCIEVRVLLGEAIWQVRSILGEIRRRWPQTANADASSRFHLVHAWMTEIEKILERDE